MCYNKCTVYTYVIKGRKIMPRKPTDLKERLINQGLRLIRKRGISALSMREITKKCGVSHSSVYRYFPHKSDYINEVMNQGSIYFGKFLVENIENVENYKLRLELMGINFIDFAKVETNLFNALFFSNQSKEIKLDKGQDFKFLAYQEFVATIQKIVHKEEVDTEVVHLWSYIMGFAVLVANHDLSMDKQWIQKNIHQMIEVYFKH